MSAAVAFIAGLIIGQAILILTLGLGIAAAEGDRALEERYDDDYE